MTFNDFLLERYNISGTWVVGRMSPDLRARYGPDVVALSPSRFKEMQLAYAMHRAGEHPAHAIIAEWVSPTKATKIVCDLLRADVILPF